LLLDDFSGHTDISAHEHLGKLFITLFDGEDGMSMFRQRFYRARSGLAGSKTVHTMVDVAYGITVLFL